MSQGEWIPEGDFFERVIDFVYPNQTQVEAARLEGKRIHSLPERPGLWRDERREEAI